MFLRCKEVTARNPPLSLVTIYAGVLELADEADSKSVGLITRAGSTPATGTRKEPTFVLDKCGFFSMK